MIRCPAGVQALLEVSWIVLFLTSSVKTVGRLPSSEFRGLSSWRRGRAVLLDEIA